MLILQLITPFDHLDNQDRFLFIQFTRPSNFESQILEVKQYFNIIREK